MSETQAETLTPTAPSPIAMTAGLRMAAQQAADSEAIRAIVEEARKPDADLAAMRERIEAMPPASYVAVSEGVERKLHREAQRSGDYEGYERVLAYLPGKEALAEVRREVDADPTLKARLTQDGERIFEGLSVLRQSEQGQRIESVAAATPALSLEQRVASADSLMSLKAVLLDDDFIAQRRAESRDPERRREIDRAVDEARTRYLSPEANAVREAISVVIEARRPDAPAEERAALNDHATNLIADRELGGQRVEIAERSIGGIMDVDRFRALVRAVGENAAAVDRPEPERPMTIRSAAEMGDAARTMRELAPGGSSAATRDALDLAEAASARGVERAREQLESRVLAARSAEALGAILADDETRKSQAAIARDPEQARRIDETIAEASERLGVAPQRRIEHSAANQSGPAEPLIEITRHGENAPASPTTSEANALPPDPQSIRDRYIIKEEESVRRYYKREDGELAIRADATHIQGRLRDVETISSMLDLASARGWNDVQIRGDREVARLTWIEATSRGMSAAGYSPSDEDRHAVEQRRIERNNPDRPLMDLPGPPDPTADRQAERRGREAPSTAERRDRSDERPTREDGRPFPRVAREPWMQETGGFDALTPAQQQSAQRSYDRWKGGETEDNPRTMPISEYVSFVQEQRELQRERERERAARIEDDRERRRHDPPSRAI